MRVIKVISLILFLMFNLMFNVFQEKKSVNASSDIYIGVVGLPDNLLYLSDESYVNNVILGNLFEGLVNLSASGNITSGIAERYIVSDDGLTYKFYMRGDAYFSNGDLITAKDFLNFFQELVRKDEKKLYYDELKYIVGMDEFYNGQIPFSEVGIDVEKVNCLVIRLKEPDNNLLQNLTKDKFSLRNNFKYLYNYKDFYEYIPYSGPYVIDNISKVENQNMKVVLKPNKYYYLNNYKTVEQKLYSYINDNDIVLEVFPTREFAIESYRTNKINFVLDVPYNSINNYYESKNLYYVYNDPTKLIFNMDEYKNETEEDTEENVEQVSMSLEEEDILGEKLSKGNFIDFIIEPGDARYINGLDSEILHKYNFNKEYLIDELNKYNLEGVKMLKIVTHSDDNYIELARSFKKFLNDEFNIKSNIIALDDNGVLSRIEKKDYNILISHFGDKEHINLNFDKPGLILSRKELTPRYIDGNGTLLINNIE